LACTVLPGLDVAFDVSRIDDSDIPSVGNGFGQLFSGNRFGSSNGPGFGWLRRADSAAAKPTFT